MKGIMIAGLALILVVAVPFTVLGESRGGGGGSHFGSNGFTVSNPNHTQGLGGSSQHACNGLSEAGEHSRSVQSAPSPAPSGSGSSGAGGGTGVVTASRTRHHRRLIAAFTAAGNPPVGKRCQPDRIGDGAHAPSFLSLCACFRQTALVSKF